MYISSWSLQLINKNIYNSEFKAVTVTKSHPQHVLNTNRSYRISTSATRFDQKSFNALFFLLDSWDLSLNYYRWWVDIILSMDVRSRSKCCHCNIPIPSTTKPHSQLLPPPLHPNLITWTLNRVVTIHNNIKHMSLTEPYNSCHCRTLNFWQIFCWIPLSCEWNVRVYRGRRERVQTRASLWVGPRRLQASAVHPFLLQSLWQTSTLSLFCSIYSAGICLCHSRVNV